MEPAAPGPEVRLDALLASRYPAVASELRARIGELVAAGRPAGREQAGDPPWSERDAWLITYPDQFGGAAPLARVAEIHRRHLADILDGVHLLPFCPSSSDEGYSVVDHLAVDPGLGTWGDVERLAQDHRVMIDAVVNHASAEGRWFRSFLAGDPRYARHFFVPDPGADLSGTVRPRATPLVHTFDRHDGPVDVWTTFSRDQVDLDFRRPEVFLDVAGVLVEYARRGATAIRLDAVSYLWKEPGTTSINRPETHEIVQLFRAVLDLVAPGVLLVTETNVPHAENVAYLGAPGEREAQAVYQFALPPLVLDAVLRGDPSVLSTWLAGLERPRPGTTWFNFLASHDGIGLRPVEGILPERHVDAMVRAVEGAGGLVSSRRVGDRLRPYELNATWRSAVGAGCDERGAIRRHLATHAVMLALQGIAGVYVHSLLATPDDHAGVAATGANRSINRRRFEGDPFRRPDPVAATALAGMRSMLVARRSSDAFHPDAEQIVHDGPVLSIERRGRTRRARVDVNLTHGTHRVPVDANWRTVDGTAVGSELPPASVRWLSD